MTATLLASTEFEARVVSETSFGGKLVGRPETVTVEAGKV